MTRPARNQPREAVLDIVELGAQGDGVALWDGARVFVPQTLPGDRVRVRFGEPRGSGLTARVTELVTPGADRIEPPCPHFGPCGGCLVQHAAPDAYRAWKLGLLTAALRHRGFAEAPVAALVEVPPGSRRRARFAARRIARGVVLGFNEAGSNRIVDLQSCLILEPAIVALLSPLRTLLAELLPPSGAADVAVTALDDGLDVVLIGLAAPDLAARERLAAWAQAADIARLSWAAEGGEPEPLAFRRPGIVRFGQVPVVLPPGGFLQATRAGEAALAALVTAAVGDGARVADLFCGAGAFTFPLAERAQVAAFDLEPPAIAALTQAARGAGRDGRIAAARRDLFHHPLTAAELARFDAVVFDPPRSGAHAQAAALAASRIPTVVAVSCNPASFARDARLLVDGGYRLEQITPVDQFPWSPHLELAAVFRR